jgi:hypothetical protein
VTYSKQLHPWCIIRILPNNQQKVIARFRRHDDATAYLKVLHHSNRNAKFLLSFEVQGVQNYLDDKTLN